MLDERYSQYFGFTKEDVLTMAAYYEKTEHFDIQLMPRDNRIPGILIELKAKKTAAKLN